MKETIQNALAFMKPKERTRYLKFVALRAIVAILDLLGILAVGFLATSVALFVSLGSSPGRVIEFAGITLSAVNARTLPLVVITILALFVGKALVSIYLTKKLAFFLAGIEARAATSVASSAFGKGLTDFRRYSKEEIYFAVQTGSPAAFNHILNSVATIFAEGVLFVLVITSFLIVDAPSGVAAIIYFGLVGILIQLFIGRLMEKAGRKNADATIEANSVIGDLSEVLREANVLDKKNFYYERIYQARMRAASSYASHFVLSGMPRYIVETALILAVALFALSQAIGGDIVSAAGILGVFLSGGLRLTASLLPLQNALLIIKQAIPQAKSALDLLADKGAVYEVNKSKNIFENQKKPPLSVELSKVTFLYSAASEPAIRDVTLLIKAGQQAALIGPSGAGKSTIADLMLGIVEPHSGQVVIGGLDPRKMIIENPGKLAYVPQRPGMVSGSIKDNVALGVPNSEVDLVRLAKAIKDSHLEEMIDSLPEGWETDLGKNRDELSGGQLQRIGLARALYTQPSLLVMDEATSSLDAKSENEINKALDELRGKTTVVLIAHRLNTVQRSDVVFLLENGALTASGTFSELRESSATVKNLAQLMSID